MLAPDDCPCSTSASTNSSLPRSASVRCCCQKVFLARLMAAKHQSILRLCAGENYAQSKEVSLCSLIVYQVKAFNSKWKLAPQPMVGAAKKGFFQICAAMSIGSGRRDSQKGWKACRTRHSQAFPWETHTMKTIRMFSRLMPKAFQQISKHSTKIWQTSGLTGLPAGGSTRSLLTN